eukprot:362995-Prymnesium_polylepis.2
MPSGSVSFSARLLPLLYCLAPLDPLHHEAQPLTDVDAILRVPRLVPGEEAELSTNRIDDVEVAHARGKHVYDDAKGAVGEPAQPACNAVSPMLQPRARLVAAARTVPMFARRLDVSTLAIDRD